MEIIRRQTNKYWPEIVRAKIVVVAGEKFGDKSRYVLQGIGPDAENLCPKNSYATQKGLLAAAKKLGWEV